MRPFGYKGKKQPQPQPPGKEFKWCGFDFDATLVTRHAGGTTFPGIKEVLQGLHAQGFRLVIFSNEGMAHLKSPQAVKKTTLTKIKRVGTFTRSVVRILFFFF